LSQQDSLPEETKSHKTVPRSPTRKHYRENDHSTSLFDEKKPKIDSEIAETSTESIVEVTNNYFKYSESSHELLYPDGNENETFPEFNYDIIDARKIVNSGNDNDSHSRETIEFIYSNITGPTISTNVEQEELIITSKDPQTSTDDSKPKASIRTINADKPEIREEVKEILKLELTKLFDVADHDYYLKHIGKLPTTFEKSVTWLNILHNFPKKKRNVETWSELGKRLVELNLIEVEKTKKVRRLF
jgi:galactitol-specific phosphotransferase system IIB component